MYPSLGIMLTVVKLIASDVKADTDSTDLVRE
jgi:hypothetical protein